MDEVSILIVEAEAIVAADLVAKLEGMGFQTVEPAHTAEDAVEIAKRSCPHLVLLDTNPDGTTNGIETAKIIQEICDNLPVIFISGNPDTAAIEGAKLTGPYGVVPKPIEQRELVSQVKKVLKNR